MKAGVQDSSSEDDSSDESSDEPSKQKAVKKVLSLLIFIFPLSFYTLYSSNEISCSFGFSRLLQQQRKAVQMIRLRKSPLRRRVTSLSKTLQKRM